jgi:hypothetical protein
MTKERKREIEVAAAIILLQRRAKRALRAAMTGVGLPLLLRASANQAPNIVTTVTSKSIVLARTTARADVRKISVLPAEIKVATGREATVDAARAIRAGTSLGEQWAKVLEEAEGDAKAAAEALGSRLDRTATTEVMSAWNTEALSLSTRAHAAGYVVTDSWHALLDACDECWELDGQTRTRPDTFAESCPLHIRCRCFIDSTFEALGAS